MVKDAFVAKVPTSEEISDLKACNRRIREGGQPTNKGNLALQEGRNSSKREKLHNLPVNGKSLRFGGVLGENAVATTKAEEARKPLGRRVSSSREKKVGVVLGRPS